MTERKDFHSDLIGLKCSICQKVSHQQTSDMKNLCQKKIIINLVLYGSNQSLVSKGRSLCLSVWSENGYCHWEKKYSELDGFGTWSLW